MGFTFRQIALRLWIAVSTAHRIFVRFRDTGELSPKKNTRKRRTRSQKLDDLHELYIIGMIVDNPGLYLSEIMSRIKKAMNIVVNGSIVCRLLHRNG